MEDAIVVAGDLPLFIAAAHASPSLRGRVVDAGRAGGAIGHVAAVGASLGDDGDGDDEDEDGDAGGGGGAVCSGERGAGNASSAAGAGGRRGGDGCAGGAAASAAPRGGSGDAAALARTKKQQGARSRAVLDVFLLSLCDYVIAAGSSSFTAAAVLPQPPGFSWLGKEEFFFFNRLRMSGHYVLQREG